MQQITGRLTADATVTTVEGGKEVVNFNLADNETYKRKGETEPVQITTYFRCAYWLSSAVAKVLKKGAVVQLQGRVIPRAYETNTGDWGASLNFHTNRIEVLAYAGNKTATTNTAKNNKTEAASKADDDLPF